MKQMSYKQLLFSEINYYTSLGYIPRLQIHLMTIIQLAKIVDYCFCIEYHKNYDDFIKTTNVGYESNITEIKKIIDKYMERD